jgi:hypothetical protein
LHVANHLNAEPEKVVSQLPDYVKGTWLDARRGVDRPY